MPIQQLTCSVFLLPGLAAVMFLAAVTLPGTAIWGIVGAWFLLVVSEAASWLVFYRGVVRGAVNPHPVPEYRDHPLPEGEGSEDSLFAEAEIPAGLVQQMTRVRAEGCESIHALVQVEFAPGELLSVAHLAFCPPLEATPKLTAHAMDADDAEVKITQAETFGARIEVRLEKVTTEARSVVLEVIGEAAVTDGSL